jgi:hypothetical protein
MSASKNTYQVLDYPLLRRRSPAVRSSFRRKNKAPVTRCSSLLRRFIACARSSAGQYATALNSVPSFFPTDSRSRETPFISEEQKAHFASILSDAAVVPWETQCSASSAVGRMGPSALTQSSVAERTELQERQAQREARSSCSKLQSAKWWGQGVNRTYSTPAGLAIETVKSCVVAILRNGFSTSQMIVGAVISNA